MYGRTGTCTRAYLVQNFLVLCARFGNRRRVQNVSRGMPCAAWGLCGPDARRSFSRRPPRGSDHGKLAANALKVQGTGGSLVPEGMRQSPGLQSGSLWLSFGRPSTAFAFALVAAASIPLLLEGQATPEVELTSPRSPRIVASLPPAEHRFPLELQLSSKATAPPSADDVKHEPEISVRIVGGLNAAKGRYPYIVYLYGSGYLCGGTLVAPNAVLTAGHCTDFTTAYVSLYDRNEDEVFEEHDIVDDVPHPEYSFESVPDRDFRLLRLGSR